MTPFPRARTEWADARAEKSVEALRAVVTRVRNFRSERGAGPTEPVELSLDPSAADRETLADLEKLAPLLQHLGASGVSALRAALGIGRARRRRPASRSASRSRARRRRRTARESEKTLADLDDEIESLGAKLRNPSFLDRAPADVVEKTRRRLVELEQRRAALRAGA